MKKVNKVWAAMGLASVLVLSGCSGSSGPAQDTAEALIHSIGQMSNEDDALKNMMLAELKSNGTLDCIVSHLDQQGWTKEQHEFFMSETGQTGSINQINQRKFSEADQMKHFGPITLALGSCM